MEGKQNLDIKLNFDKPTFYIGELLTGHIILYTEKSSVIEKILVTITLTENWDVNNKSFKPVYNSRIIGSLELDLNILPNISKVDGCYIIPGGVNKLPFKIRMLDDLYPCFEYPFKNIFASLRYRFNIKVFSMSFKNVFFMFNLQLFSRPNIDYKKKCLNKSITKTLKKWKLFDIGTTTLTVSIPDNNFKFDDTNFKIICHIDNSNGKETTKGIKLSLMRVIEFYNTNNMITYKEEIPISFRDIPCAVDPGSKIYVDVFLPLREYDTSKYSYNIKNPKPYNINMYDINYYMPTIFTRYITCKYELIVILNFNCNVSENTLPKVTFPIYLVNQSTLEYQKEIQEKELEKSKIDKMFGFSYNNKNNQQNNINNINKINIINNNINNNKNKINNFYNINNNIFNNEENINQLDAPAPFINEQKIGIGVNIIDNNNNNFNFQNNNINNVLINHNFNDNKNKIYTNKAESINIGQGNNINYNFNININSHIDNNSNSSGSGNSIINNNFNNNINNNINLISNNLIENSNNLIDNESNNNNEIKNIKESKFSIFD